MCVASARKCLQSRSKGERGSRKSSEGQKMSDEIVWAALIRRIQGLVG